MIQYNLTSLLAVNETWAIHSNDSWIDANNPNSARRLLCNSIPCQSNCNPPAYNSFAHLFCFFCSAFIESDTYNAIHTMVGQQAMLWDKGIMNRHAYTPATTEGKRSSFTLSLGVVWVSFIVLCSTCTAFLFRPSLPLALSSIHSAVVFSKLLLRLDNVSSVLIYTFLKDFCFDINLFINFSRHSKKMMTGALG